MSVQNLTHTSLELLLDVSRELAASLDLRTVIGRVLSLSTSNIGAERGTLIVLDEAGRPIEAALTIHDTVFHPQIAEIQAILNDGLAGWVAAQRQAVIVANTSLDARWTRRPDDAAERSGSKSAICVPLVAYDQLVGVLTLVHAQTNFFTPAHLALLQAIADLAGIAVRNASLYHAIQEEQRRYHELFEDYIDPIFISTWEGKILECNRSAGLVTGMPAARLVDRSVLEVHTPEAAALGENFDRLKSGQTVRYESLLKREGADSLPVEVYVRLQTFNQQETLQWIFRDNSQRKLLDKMRDDLASMIYHDLRSPLANIISSLDILDTLLPAESNDSVPQVLDIAVRAADRMQRLISSLLDINRLESGQGILHTRPFDLTGVIGEAVDAVTPLVTSRRQNLEVISGSLPPVNMDPDMIRRVLINLLENAIKFSPVEGNLEIGSRLEGASVRVWVRDSGQGIPEAFHETIFEKYHQLHDDQRPKGFGIGLAFCRLALQAHSGKIWVESQPGGGSTFWFELPVG